MSFWSAIPVVGGLIDSIGAAIDKNVTTDEERLKLKSELASHIVPVIAAVVEAQKSHNELQARVAEVEAKSEHWLVWSRRPIVSILTALNMLVSLWLSVFKLGVEWEVVEFSFYAFCLANGLDMTTRGVEKVVRSMKAKEEI